MADVTTLGMAVDSTGVVKATDDLDGMVRAGKSAEQSMSGFEGAMTMAVAKGELLKDALEKVLSVAVDLTKQFWELTMGVAKYQELAVKIGSNDPAGLASLQTAADRSNTSIDSVAMAINRMAMMMGRSKGDLSGAGEALKNLGINFNDFKKLDPVAQYEALAKATGDWGNSQEVVQNIQRITGRNGAEQIAMLRAMNEVQEHATLLTNENIKAAHELEESFRQTKSEVKQFIQAVGAEGLLPVMISTIKSFKDTATEIFGVRNKTEDLISTAGIVRTWAQEVAMVVAHVADSFVNAGIGIEKAQIRFHFFEQVPKIGWTAALKEANAALLDLWKTSSSTPFADNLAKAFAAQKGGAGGTWGESDKPHPDAPTTPGANSAAKEAEAATKAYKDFIQSIHDKTDAMEMELSGQEKLTESQSMELALNQQMKALNLTGARKAAAEQAILNAAAEADDVAALRVRIALEAKQSEEFSKQATKRHNEAFKEAEDQEKSADRAERDAAIAKEKVDSYGMEEGALEKLQIVRKRAEAQVMQDLANATKQADSSSKISWEYQRQADALNAIADSWENLAAKKKKSAEDPMQGATDAMTEYMKKVKDVGTSTKEAVGESLNMLEDTLTNFFTKGKLDASALIDYIINQFVRLAIVRPMMASLFGGGEGGGGGGIFGSLFSMLGLFMGGGSKVPLGSGVNLGNSGGGGGFWGSVKLGGSAAGGDIGANTLSEVAERGPEMANIGGKSYLLTGSKSGNITPNGAGGANITMAPNIRIDARSDAGQVASNVRAAITESQKALIAELRAQGVIR